MAPKQPTRGVQDLLRQPKALSNSDFEWLVAVVNRDPALAHALRRLELEARVFDDDGPTHLHALIFANPRREWIVMHADGAWVLSPPQPRGRGHISRLPSRKKLGPTYHEILKNAQALRRSLRAQKATPARGPSIIDARAHLRDVVPPPWRTLEVLRQNDELVIAMNGRSLDVTFSEFLKGAFEPRRFALDYLAAWLPGQPSAATVRAKLARK